MSVANCGCSSYIDRIVWFLLYQYTQIREWILDNQDLKNKINLTLEKSFFTQRNILLKT